MMSFLLSNRKTTEGQLVGGVEREEEQEEEKYLLIHKPKRCTSSKKKIEVSESERSSLLSSRQSGDGRSSKENPVGSRSISTVSIGKPTQPRAPLTKLQLLSPAASNAAQLNCPDRLNTGGHLVFSFSVLTTLLKIKPSNCDISGPHLHSVCEASFRPLQLQP
ncbi:Hypothetical protein SMAX5B_021741 [Scophthalmus maximus]|uniref:Uncharacterized protein n=1 Tax=Scophthalmus maximus TaxID=52904 RepID=A0A2U9BKZ4_SCOMX|nr:Hypothetical protein SMAX5B_021741 [Scophthalmus maximus]